MLAKIGKLAISGGLEIFGELGEFIKLQNILEIFDVIPTK